MRSPARFRYLGDPICAGSLVLYLVGRWILRPHHLGGAFVQGYLNDVLCLPLFLPMILLIQRRIGLRRHDLPPRLWEVLQHWMIFSVLFEVVLPQFPGHFTTTADPLDVVAYLAGGLVAWAIWHWQSSCQWHPELKFETQAPSTSFFKNPPMRSSPLSICGILVAKLRRTWVSKPLSL